MKRGGVLLVIVLVLLATFFFLRLDLGTKIQGMAIAEEGDELSIASSLDENSSKIASEVLEVVEEQEEVRVMVNIKPEENGEVSVENIAEVAETLSEVKNEFDDSVSAVVSEEELLELQNNPEVASVEIVRSRSVSMQDTAPLVNATQTWNLQVSGINLTGVGETICIIDTGINYNHTDFGNCYGNNDENSGCKILGGFDFCADDSSCTTTDTLPNDVHGHGSHVAGTVAANGSIKGIAPGAKLIIMKAANASGTFWDDDIEQSIDWCVANATKFNISVISMSLGGGLYSSYCNDDPLNDSINNAVANNISVIVASGNSGSTTQIAAPACHENVIPVGGSDKSDAMYSNGNRNSLVLLLAPGVSINSTYKTNDQYALSSGTSMSTPHVAGTFALIIQYLRLEKNTAYTPAQIENLLNSTGKRIYDSGSGLNYSRINLYSAIYSLDDKGPSVSLTSPAHNSYDTSYNQTFACTASDLFGVDNMTFYLWNKTNSVVNQTTFDTSDNSSASISINVSNLANGSYTWNCLAFDTKGNSNWSNTNYTKRVGNMVVTLSSPSDNTYKNTGNTNFTCISNDTVASLANTTLYVWNSTALKYNSTTSISGDSNTTVMNYTFASDGRYTWNCYTLDNESNLIYGTNRTITYDSTSPSISLTSPADDDTDTEGEIDFKYRVTEANSITSCSLYIDGNSKETDTTVSTGTTQTISYDLDADDYVWKIRCVDSASNTGTSATYSLAVETEEDSESSSSGGSGSTTTTSTSGSSFSILDADLKIGASKYMKETDAMKFSLKGENHTLTLKDLTDKEIKVEVTSTPVSAIIKVGATEKINVDADGTYDLAVTYIEYKNTLGKVQIKEIDEQIPTRTISNDSNNTGFASIGSGQTVSGTSFMSKKVWIILSIIFGVLILAGFGFWLYQKKTSGVTYLDPILRKFNSSPQY